MALQPYHLATIGIGIGVAVAIFRLVRKNQLMVSHAIWWLTVAAASTAFGVYPRLIDKIGAFLGIHYPPTLLIVIGMGLILIKMLTMDLKLSEKERNIRALTQRLAILESAMDCRHLYPENPAAGSSPVTYDGSGSKPVVTTQGEGTQAEASVKMD